MLGKNKKKPSIAKKIKFAFDLDGVIVGKPFFVPKGLLEWLVRSHSNQKENYRFPKFRPEIWLRVKSHHWFLRPSMKKNLRALKNISKQKNIELYIISGRYNFLKQRTNDWLKKNSLEKIFKGVFINQNNQQPHLFKEKMIKRLKIDHFFEDDPLIVKYLKGKAKKTQVHFINKDGQLAQPQ